MFYYFNFNAFIRFFVKVLIEQNENIINELNFPDVYRNLNYIGLLESLHEPLRISFSLHATECSLHLDKPQKNEIYS